ncbi:MAG: cytidine deaminase [Peptococcaceae bacterium]|jgi:cytidine deaminase|nr:cytidine deaminase [Peptococcaceae bacterium]
MMIQTADSERLEQLMRAAREACRNAYAPYSNYPVGAAALFASGKIYAGCNVENASFGLTICAERNAIFQGAACGERRLLAVAIAVPASNHASPCGACRQVMREFAADCRIILLNDSDPPLESSLRDLLPDSFGPEFLQGK